MVVAVIPLRLRREEPAMVQTLRLVAEEKKVQEIAYGSPKVQNRCWIKIRIAAKQKGIDDLKNAVRFLHNQKRLIQNSKPRRHIKNAKAYCPISIRSERLAPTLCRTPRGRKMDPSTSLRFLHSTFPRPSPHVA